MSKSTHTVFCTDCGQIMEEESKNKAVWWVCSAYPRCPVTAFEYRGKPLFTHEDPFVAPPKEMPLYLDLTCCY